MKKLFWILMLLGLLVLFVYLCQQIPTVIYMIVIIVCVISSLLATAFMWRMYRRKYPKIPKSEVVERNKLLGGTWTKVKEKEMVGPIILWTCIVVGCHYLLYYLLPEVWTALSVKPFFWMSHVLIPLIIVLCRKEVTINIRGDKAMRIPGFAKIAIGIILVINLVQYTGPNVKANLDVGGKFKAMMPAESDPPARVRVEENKIVVIAPVGERNDDNWSGITTIYGKGRSCTVWYTGKVWVRPDSNNKRIIEDGPYIYGDVGSSKTLEFKSREDKPVTVTIIFK